MASISENKNHLVVDDYAAGVVRNIFEWKIDGYSFGKIAEMLNRRGILSPMEYKRANGEKYCTGFQTGVRGRWSAVAIRRILMDETYTGAVVQGKTERVNYKIKKSVSKPRNEWVRIPDAHESIVPKDQFDIVQQLLQTDCRASSGKETSHLYSGLLYCGDCGEPMVRRVSRYKGKTVVRFICSNYNRNRKCDRHNILQQDLDQIVLYGIRSQIEVVLDRMKVISGVQDLEMQYDDIAAFDQEIVRVKTEQEKYKKLRVALYGDYKKGIISEEDFRTFSTIYEEKCAGLQSDLDRQTENLKHLFRNGLLAGKKLDQYKEVMAMDALNRPVLVRLVKKIYIYMKINEFR